MDPVCSSTAVEVTKIIVAGVVTLGAFVFLVALCADIKIRRWK